MIAHIRKKSGSYTLEAAIFLPLVILAVITIGIFIRIDSSWENCCNGVFDECSISASKAVNGIETIRVRKKVKTRIAEENPNCDFAMGLLFYRNHIVSFSFSQKIAFNMPFDFGREKVFKSRIKYREFVGLKTRGKGLGIEGLEAYGEKEPVWIFPQSGIRYHKAECRYVKASVSRAYLTRTLRQTKDPCSSCKSGDLNLGSLVFCFGSEDSAYHRGNCKTIKKQTVVINRVEAVDRGYTPCSLCNP